LTGSGARADSDRLRSGRRARSKGRFARIEPPRWWSASSAHEPRQAVAGAWRSRPALALLLREVPPSGCKSGHPRAHAGKIRRFTAYRSTTTVEPRLLSRSDLVERVPLEQLSVLHHVANGIGVPKILERVPGKYDHIRQFPGLDASCASPQRDRLACGSPCLRDARPREICQRPEIGSLGVAPGLQVDLDECVSRLFSTCCNSS